MGYFRLYRSGGRDAIKVRTASEFKFVDTILAGTLTKSSRGPLGRKTAVVHLWRHVFDQRATATAVGRVPLAGNQTHDFRSIENGYKHTSVKANLLGQSFRRQRPLQRQLVRAHSLRRCELTLCQQLPGMQVNRLHNSPQRC